MSDPIESTAQAIRSMHVRGAARIGCEAARALAEHVQGEGDLGQLRERALDGARRLAASRPTAVTLRNALQEVLRAVHEAASAKEAAHAARAAADLFARRSGAAAEAIAGHVVGMMGAEETVLTHCHSSRVVAAIVRAHGEGRCRGAVVTETRPWGQGHVTARQLAEAGVPVHFIVDSAMRHAMEGLGVDRVLVGADAVDAEGGLYNKIGTRQAALAAHDAGLPLYCLAERHKFSPFSLAGEEVEVEEREAAEVDPDGRLPAAVQVWNPVFDRTPPGLVAGYVCEEGVVAPGEAQERIRSWHGGVPQWV